MTSQKFKCRHLDCTITEFYLVASEWEVTAGFLSEEALHDTGGGELQQHIEVRCKNCGMSRRFNRNKVPVWLKLYMGESL